MSTTPDTTGFPLLLTYLGDKYVQTGKVGRRIDTGVVVAEYANKRPGWDARCWADATDRTYPD